MKALRSALILWTILAASLAAAQQVKSTTASTPRTPVDIKSDQLELQSESGKVLFRGHVYARQGSFELTSDSLTATYDKVTRDVQLLEARGRVKFRDGNRSGQADRALYAVDVSELTMTGRPVVRDGDNTLAGTVIHYSTLSGRLRVQQARTSFQRDAIPKSTP